MALIPISIAETLRPWRGAGVFHFLQDPLLLENLDSEMHALLLEQMMPHTTPAEPQQSRLAREAMGISASTRKEHGYVPSLTQANQPAQQNEALIAGETQGKPSASEGAFSSLPPSRTSSLTKASSSKMGNTTSSKAPQASVAKVALQLDLQQWPLTWQRAFNAVKPAPILWTYKNLAQDLSGNADPKHSSCLRSIIGTLRFPKGTSCFWAPTLVPPSDATSEQDALYFLSGVQLLAPKMIIVLGSDALPVFAPQISLSVAFTQGLYQGKLIVLLPSLAELAERDDLVKKSVTYLRACVAQIPSITL